MAREGRETELAAGGVEGACVEVDGWVGGGFLDGKVVYLERARVSRREGRAGGGEGGGWVAYERGGGGVPGFVVGRTGCAV